MRNEEELPCFRIQPPHLKEQLLKTTDGRSEAFFREIVLRFCGRFGEVAQKQRIVLHVIIDATVSDDNIGLNAVVKRRNELIVDAPRSLKRYAIKAARTERSQILPSVDIGKPKISDESFSAVSITGTQRITEG